MQDDPSSSMYPSDTHDTATWKAYWNGQGQLWRTEPLLDEERQQRLLRYWQGEVDIERGMYPFKGVRLSRADVEWLLAMQEQRSSQVHTGESTSGKQQQAFGLDVRGADLSEVNLSSLPLTALHAGLSLQEGRHATVEQSRQAAVNLSHEQLQKAQLSWAILDGTVLVEAHLEGADLGKARLAQAILAGTYFEGADRFAYRAQVLQRRVLRRSGTGAYGSYLFSGFLDVLAGYGYKPGRTVVAYLSTILSFAIIYYELGHFVGKQPSMSPLYALIVSIISFHGRGFFPAGFLPTLPMAICASCEAIIGLTIEISFIATFTQRYFGK